MYYVVFYEDWCSTIPELWLNTENKTFQWPLNELNVKTAAIKNAHPKNTWNVQSYKKIIGPYETYEIARQVEQNISMSKDGQFEILGQFATLPKKRLINKPLFDDEIEDYDNDRYTKKKAKCVPSSSSDYKSTNASSISNSEKLSDIDGTNCIMKEIAVQNDIQSDMNIDVQDKNAGSGMYYIFLYSLYSYILLLYPYNKNNYVYISR
ncbi:uncharacterized protein, partial [Temnothorax longispinosus]|uniref:uncharacterized protein n=1 Tax=Temnothorax longispinosus TaxID=300112 RepID=UPI003A99F55D